MRHIAIILKKVEGLSLGFWFFSIVWIVIDLLNADKADFLNALNFPIYLVLVGCCIFYIIKAHNYYQIESSNKWKNASDTIIDSPAQKTDSRLFKRESYLALVWFITISATLRLLMLCGKLVIPDHGFWNYEIDYFNVFLASITIIGLVWTIMGRLDAESAKISSQQTLATIGSTFDFDEILEKRNLGEVFHRITNGFKKYDPSSKEGLVSAYFSLGFPVIGYLTDRVPKSSSGTFLDDFCTFLERIEDNDFLAPQQELKISVFKRDTAFNVLKKYSGEAKLTEKDKNKIELKLDVFYCRIEALVSKWKDNPLRGVFYTSTSNNLRFVCLKSKRENHFICKSYVWVVPQMSDKENTLEGAATKAKLPLQKPDKENTLEDTANKVKFDSFVFTSSDPRYLTMLIKLFRKEKKETKTTQEKNNGNVEVSNKSKQPQNRNSGNRKNRNS